MDRPASSLTGPAGSRTGGLLARDFALPFDARTALAAGAMALCWLHPNGFLPWPSFQAEFGMTVVVLLLAAGAWLAGRGTRPVPAAALFALAVALVPPLQHAFGLVRYAGDAWMSSAALAGFALAIAAGAALDRRKAGAVADAVLGAALCASIVSVGIQLWQWLRLAGAPELQAVSGWLLDLPAGARPSGNLGQPNQLATLLLWGLAGVWWAHLRRQVGGAVAVLAAAFLLFGLAMTQSRSGWVGLLAVAVMAWAYRRRLGPGRWPAALAVLGLGFAGTTLAWPAINEALHLTAAQTLESRLTAGARSLNWQVCLAAIGERPWSGHGWGQVAAAQQDALLRAPASGEYFAYAHDIVLDLLLWNGVPLGGLVALASAAWLARRFARVASPGAAVLAMAVGAFVVHALVEYPHAYFHFLLPFGLLLGALGGATGAAAPVALPRAAAAVLAMAFVWAGWVLHDYLRAQEGMHRLRFENARIVTPADDASSGIRMLTQLREQIETLRVNVREPVDAATLERLHHTSRRYASDTTIFRYAMAAALAGRTGDATHALRRLCTMHAADGCARVREAWTHEARALPPAPGGAMERAGRAAWPGGGRAAEAAGWIAG